MIFKLFFAISRYASPSTEQGPADGTGVIYGRSLPTTAAQYYGWNMFAQNLKRKYQVVLFFY